MPNGFLIMKYQTIHKYGNTINKTIRDTNKNNSGHHLS